MIVLIVSCLPARFRGQSQDGRGTRGVTVIVLGYGHGDSSSNTGRE